jgi:hypothetical protein
MFVCMLCMAAVTNLDTQSRRTGLPVVGHEHMAARR